MPLAISGWWVAGWAVGFGGAVIAAVLLVAIIRLGRRIASQGDEIRSAIEGSRRNTTPLFDLARVNLALDRIGRELKVLREGSEP